MNKVDRLNILTYMPLEVEVGLWKKIESLKSIMKLTKKPYTHEDMLNDMVFEDTIEKLREFGVIKPELVATFVDAAKNLKQVGARLSVINKDENESA